MCPFLVCKSGFWVSSHWLSNAKKYYEGLNASLPAIIPSASGKSSKKRVPKIGCRRGSDVLPPWPSMNADITCVHGNILTKGSGNAKKRLIDSRAWKFLRKFYCQGGEFRSKIAECSQCIECHEERQTSLVDQCKEELRRRFEKVPPALYPLLGRKSGVPKSVTPWARKILALL